MTTHSTLTDQTDSSVEIPSQLLTGAGGATNGAGVDMQGWEGVVFTINLGVLTGSGALDAYAQSSPTSKTCTDMANITGSAITQVLTAKQNNAVQISIYRPTQRYVRCVLNQTVNNVQVSVTATRFRRSGVNPSANVGAPAQSPSEIKAVVQN
jgi:hypothetical protein